MSKDQQAQAEAQARKSREAVKKAHVNTWENAGKGRGQGHAVSVTDEPSGTCVACSRRDPEVGQVCPGCRSRLANWLREIPNLYADLLARDDVLRSAGGFGWVSGTHEAPVPIRVDAVDLTLPARGPVSDADHDQIGHLSVAAVLDSWMRDWREHRDVGEGLPDPQVPVLCRWLGDRLDDACDSHPAVDEFAAELADLRRALYGVLGLFDVPDYKQGVPCRACDMLALVRRSGSDFIECEGCGLLLSPQEYADWTALQAAHLKGRAA